MKNPPLTGVVLLALGSSKHVASKVCVNSVIWAGIYGKAAHGVRNNKLKSYIFS
jgi:hypothetical protein